MNSSNHDYYPAIRHEMKRTIVVYLTDNMKHLAFCIVRNADGNLIRICTIYRQLSIAYFWLLPPLERKCISFRVS